MLLYKANSRLRSSVKVHCSYLFLLTLLFDSSLFFSIFSSLLPSLVKVWLINVHIYIQFCYFQRDRSCSFSLLQNTLLLYQFSRAVSYTHTLGLFPQGRLAHDTVAKPWLGMLASQSVGVSGFSLAQIWLSGFVVCPLSLFLALSLPVLLHLSTKELFLKLKK